MYTVLHGGDIHKGDLIAVSNGSYMSIGIYLGRGQGGSVQYLWPGSATSQRDWHEEQLKNWKGDKPMKPMKISQMGKNFLISPTPNRIIKLNRENITDQETIERLLEDKEVLKEFNITVNY
jgi:hypothetical protein